MEPQVHFVLGNGSQDDGYGYGADSDGQGYQIVLDMNGSAWPDGLGLGGHNGSDFWEHNLEEVLKEFLFTHKEPRTIVLICFYVPVFLFALLGNLLVILVIMANRNMRSVTNFFLINLSVADLLVTVVCIPLTVGETVFKAWVYGKFLCKITGYLQGVSVAASVLTIMALSLERYIAINHPVKSRRLTTVSHVTFMVLLIWLIACVIMVPLAVVRHMEEHPLAQRNGAIAFCHEKWPELIHRQIYDVFLFMFIYIIPGTVVVVSYSATGCHLISSNLALHRQDSDVYQSNKIMAGRRRVARMLLVLAILFALTWLPYYIITIYMNFSSTSDSKKSLGALSFSLLLGHSHSAMNPILYCIMNSSFKRGMLALVRCRRVRMEHSSVRSDPRLETNHGQRVALSIRRVNKAEQMPLVYVNARHISYSEPRDKVPETGRHLLASTASSDEETSICDEIVANGNVVNGVQHTDITIQPLSPVKTLAAIYEENGQYQSVIQSSEVCTPPDCADC